MSPAVRHYCYLRDGRHFFFRDIFIEVKFIYYNRLFSEPPYNIVQFDTEDGADQTDGEDGEGEPLPEGNPPLRLRALPPRVEPVDKSPAPHVVAPRTMPRRDPGDGRGDRTGPRMERRWTRSTQGRRFDSGMYKFDNGPCEFDHGSTCEFDSRTTQFEQSTQQGVRLHRRVRWGAAVNILLPADTSSDVGARCKSDYAGAARARSTLRTARALLPPVDGRARIASY